MIRLPSATRLPAPRQIGRRGLLLAGLLLPLAAIRPAQAANPAAAANFIQQLGQYTLGILQQPLSLPQREAQLRELLRQGFDLPFIARFVLGRAYNGLTPDQAAEYQQVFSDFVLRSYARRLAGFQASGFNILGTRAVGDSDTEVATRIDPQNGQPIRCDWRVREFAGPRLGIIDVTVEGVSMALTQRDEFTAVASSRGVGDLIGVLRARADRESISAVR